MLALTAIALASDSENIIQPDLSLIVVLVLLLIFIPILNRILFKPVTHVLNEREALTEGASAEARAAARQYQARLAEYEASIRQARVESYRKMEEKRALALEGRSRLIDEIKRKAAGEIEEAKSEVARQAAAARAILESEARQIAERISQAILGRSLGGGAD